MYIVKLLSGISRLFTSIIDNYNLPFILGSVLYIYTRTHTYTHTESKAEFEALCLDSMAVSVVQIFLVAPSPLLSAFAIFSNEKDVKTLPPTLEHGNGVGIGLILTCGSQHIV